MEAARTNHLHSYTTLLKKYWQKDTQKNIQIKKDLPLFIETIKKETWLREILVFGSAVDEWRDECNDLDLIIVYDETKTKAQAVIESLLNLAKSDVWALPLDIKVVNTTQSLEWVETVTKNGNCDTFCGEHFFIGAESLFEQN